MVIRILVGFYLLLGSSAWAATVATFGSLSASDVPAPHTATDVTLGDIESGALAGYDVFVIGHPGSWSAQACTELASFIAGGGGVVTEWNAVTLLFDTLGGSIYAEVSPQCALFTGTVDNGDSLASDTPIDIIDGASPIVGGLSDPFSMGGGSEFFYTVSGFNGTIWNVVAEFTGFAGTWPAIMWSSDLGGFVVAAVMDYQDVLPGNATASTLLDNMITFADTGAGVAPEARATFEVTKDFTDDNPNGVEVTISCNTGLPLEQSQVITEAEGVEFVVVEYDDGELDCEITEDVLNGYDATYFDGTANSSTSCEFVDVAHGAENSCRITNEPLPVDIDIEKDWVFEGTTDGDGIGLRYDVTVWCDAEIVGGIQIAAQGVESPSGIPGCGQIVFTQESPQLIAVEWCKTFYGEGPLDDTHTAQVIPEYPESNCLVFENVYDNAIETSNGCGLVTVSAGQGASCTITNTVFFEGIPTLNQYGLAVLALLMLGIGVVGFRRIV